MDLTGNLSSLATHMAQTRQQQTAELAVLKKAIDQQASNALALLEALPQVGSSAAVSPAPSLPANLGQNINVVV
ncbi:MAG: YjfB family protein [Pseudomonadales bacterium]|nr:YjfB family protein [Pseudomonadales bacterium]